ncbi:MAG TPA: DUF1648 domain-containing protein [Nitrospirota bacterium]|nr:DUF1648 domain-containing protein [Nitrospirota bacterium]
MKTNQRRISLVLIGIGILQMLFYAPRLPEHMASHFGGSGDPNGWSGKAAFFGIYAGILVMVFLLFHALPGLLSRFPDAMINLPNKEYWLAPERRASTFSRIKDYFVSMGIGLIIFLLFTLQLVIQANLREDRHLDSTVLWILLVVFAVFTIVWSIRFIRMFRMQAGQSR